MHMNKYMNHSFLVAGEFKLYNMNTKCDDYCSAYDWISIQKTGSYATGGLNPAHHLQRSGSKKWEEQWWLEEEFSAVCN